ncbi:MAG: hypothetical protein HYX21_02260 [Candidatus Yanofskybacteria bacterium]|nr:hypothetical protein [Candidatus Yanofskybacteria bacterium]
MVKFFQMPTPAITKKLTQKGDFVIIPRKEYEEFLKFNSRPVYKPTKTESRMIKRAREDFKKGNYITLEELKKKLGF